jgi:membrane-associated phospholipid phosphatase
MTNAFARALSIVGHPMLVLPLAVLLLSRAHGDGGDGDSGGAWWLGLGFGFFGAVVMGYSWWQVRRGRWAHVDASAKHERGSLNRFLLIALAIAALLATVLTPQNELALGLGLSAGLIAIAMLTARWCKLSLHMAFAVFAAAMLSRLGWEYGVPAAVFVAAIAWSRLALRRHTPGDLLAGMAAGVLAGLVFWFMAARNGG